MPFQKPPILPNFEVLKSVLVQAGLQTSDPPLYQTIVNFLDSTSKMENIFDDRITELETIIDNLPVVGAKVSNLTALVNYREDELEPFIPGAVDGKKGDTGATGAAGAAGPAGSAGVVGIDGIDGLDGRDSLIPGPIGPTGATGASGSGGGGLSGPPGLDGIDGESYPIPLFNNEGRSLDEYIRRDGTVALTADWDAGSFDIRAAELTADALTAAAVVFTGTAGLLSEDLTNFGWDNSAKFLRVGPDISAITTPEFLLSIESTTTVLFAGWRHGSSASGAGFTFGHSRGTIASPVTLSQFDTLGGIDLRGYDAAAYSNTQALFAGFANETWSAGNHGTGFVFQTTRDGSTTLTTRLGLSAQGNLIIGTSVANDPSTGDTSIIIADGTVPATLASNTAGLYVNDVGGNVTPFSIAENGATFNLNPTFNALGGGAAPTLGTIGGAGPTAAAQSGWMRMNTSGTNFWVPYWL